MNNNYQKCIKALLVVFYLVASQSIHAQFTAVGSGSYRTNFPGTDEAGRNAFPGGSPLVSGNAVGKPVPTNDWWSLKIKQNHVNNLFNYPLALRTVNQGLVVSYIVPASTANGSSQPMDDALPITVGVTGLNAGLATVSDFSDWTVNMNWTNGTRSFTATAGIGMPFLYFTKNTSDVAEVKVTEGTVTISNEMLLVTNSHQGADFAVYAPVGSTWTQNGTTYTSTLNNKNYWSIAYLPPNAANLTTVANQYKQYAYVFPTNTTATWTYNENNSKLTTTFNVTTSVKEGAGTNVLLGLLPHQWAHLSAGSPQPTGATYSSIRGDLKLLAGNTFTVENTFKGILTTLPYVDNNSPGFSAAALTAKIDLIKNDQLDAWTDSYNEGQLMNRLIQTARIADEMGNTAARNTIVATIKARLQDWLKAESGEVAFLFYYNSNWSAMLGYPAGHGQDSNINDHHFHWGYFIHAAAFMEQFEPGWAAQWGPMIDLLVRDAASPDRNDPLFPYLRNFSPYAGHSWANGFATFPFGNDQESTSESMQFASSLIHWGTITENDAVRDLGIYIYTTEQSAIEEYWFDMHNRIFKPGYGYSVVSRVWGNGYDNQTFWTGDIEAAYGIEMYPIHGGSLYMGHNLDYVADLWDEISVNTGILTNEANANLWHDTYWQYLAFIDAPAAIDLYDSYPDRELKFGISDAQTYHWLHAMNALGPVNDDVTANYPIAAVFTNDGGNVYVAHNYGDTPITVTFSDGYTLDVPAHELVTSMDLDVSGVLSADIYQVAANGIVNLTTAITGTGVTKVAFYDGETLIGEDTTAPYQMPAPNLSPGFHTMSARVYVDGQYNTTNTIQIIVGEQVPYSGTPFQIPGTIQAGNYDIYQGGNGQNITYYDTTLNNEGTYRPAEYVDSAIVPNEGPTVGWITAGEWMEYTVNVQTPGMYTATIRYASGNAGGGGPFHFEIDGVAVSPAATVTATGNWGTWANKVVNNVALTQGQHILRFVVTNGGFNLGNMTFAFAGPLNYEGPEWDASISLYPNPAYSVLHIESKLSAITKVEVFSVLGTKVLETTKSVINIEDLSEGIYLVKVNAGGRSVTKKLIVR